MTHSYVDSYESSNVEEHIYHVGDSGPILIGCSVYRADEERWRSELVGAMRVCVRRSINIKKTIDMTLNNPLSSMTPIVLLVQHPIPLKAFFHTFLPVLGGTIESFGGRNILKKKTLLTDGAHGGYYQDFETYQK